MKTRRLSLTISAAALAAAVIGPTSPALGKGKPGGGGGGDGDGLITNPAFAYEESDGIYVTTIDGSQMLKLTNPKARTDDCCPSWSPDLDPDTLVYEGKIAYLNLYERKISADPFVMYPDGSGKQLMRRFSDFPIPNESHVTSLAWSPNGREIIFSSLGDRLHAVEIATGNVRVPMERLFENRQIGWPCKRAAFTNPTTENGTVHRAAANDYDFRIRAPRMPPIKPGLPWAGVSWSC
jgi:hypothetical protein